MQELPKKSVVATGLNYWLNHAVEIDVQELLVFYLHLSVDINESLMNHESLLDPGHFENAS